MTFRALALKICEIFLAWGGQYCISTFNAVKVRYVLYLLLYLIQFHPKAFLQINLITIVLQWLIYYSQLCVKVWGPSRDLTFVICI